MTALTYNLLVSSLQNLLVDSGSTEFNQILPQSINFAEGKCYRELDLLSDRLSDTSVTLTAATRNATCLSSVSIVEGIAILTPAGQIPPTAKRIGVDRASLDFIDRAFPDESVTGVPQYYAMKTDTNIVFGPSPDSAYKIEITGTGQPPAMSSTQQTSPLGNLFPDLLLAANMIFMSAWQRDVGSPASPQDANTWQQAYDSLFKSATEFIQRQKSQDPNWNPYTATPMSTPRG